jgi:hypothetical protein
MELLIVVGVVLMYLVGLSIGHDMGENSLKRRIILYMIEHIDDTPEEVLNGVRDLL